ncbi:MAG: NADPH:quinone reductase [Pollutimonas bauzanensis]|uniref:NADPH2:quinone reductase n=1 Tax=Pollutimonas bauzanensis TaxID=658167 RepID=A0A1M5SN21_9BURK|nr:NADPH:quinone reductase [Pollutimonas bauzanensis]SHH39353.1 NADPH2:quinone reductase [Pollutimonas bauzanensis]
MKAAWYDRRGPAREVLEIGDLPKPEARAGEVLVRVHATGVNPSDTKSRQGGGTRSNPFPRVVPHQDGAGIIEAVGPGVDAGRVGERVWVYEAQLGRPFGCAAEYTAVPSINAVSLPDAVSYEEGACLGVPALTAHYSVMADGPVAGQVVLVTGGSGAVSFYAIQFARLAGATVITTVRTREQADVARQAGADHILYRLDDDIVARIAEITGVPDGRAVDRIVDVAFGANLETSLKVLKPNGVIASYASDQVPVPALPFWPLVGLNATLRCVLVYAMSRKAHDQAIAAVTQALLAGTLKHNIAMRYRLDQIVQAHEMLESGSAIGKVMLAVD